MLGGGRYIGFSEAIKLRKPWYVADCRRTPRFRDHQMLSLNGARSLLVLPVMHADRVIALIQLSTTRPASISEAHARVLQPLCAQAAISLHASFLLREVLAASKQLTKSIAAQPAVVAAFGAVSTHLAPLLPGTAFALLVCDAARSRPVSRYSYVHVDGTGPNGAPAGDAALPVHEDASALRLDGSLAQWVVANGQIMGRAVSEVEPLPDVDSWAAEARRANAALPEKPSHLLFLPILDKERNVTAVLQLMRAAPRRFTQTEQNVAELAAANLGLCDVYCMQQHNASIFECAYRVLAELDRQSSAHSRAAAEDRLEAEAAGAADNCAALKAGAGVADALNQSHEVFVRSVCSQLNVEHCMLLAVCEEQGYLRSVRQVLCMAGREALSRQLSIAGSAWFGAALQGRASCAEGQLISQVDLISELDWAEAHGATSVMAVPIHIAGELRALLAVADPVRRNAELPCLRAPLVGFDARDEALLQLLASVYGHRLARHLEQIQEHRQLRDLDVRIQRHSDLMVIEQRLNREVELQSFCKQLLAAFVQMLDCSWAALYVPPRDAPPLDGDSGGVCLRFSMEAGCQVNVADFGTSRLLDGMLKGGHAVRSVSIDEFDELVDSSEFPRSVGVMHSFLAQPLHDALGSRPKCVAVLLAINKQAEGDTFSADDGMLAAKLAEVCAAATLSLPLALRARLGA